MSRIYVDLDDVLGETGLMFLDVLERDFGRKVEFDAIHSYHLSVSFKLSQEELTEFLRVSHEPEALAAIEPIDGAIEAINGWADEGYDIVVVTGRPPDTRDDTLAWLDKHGFSYSEFHFLDKYSIFYNGAHGDGDGSLSLEDLQGMDFCLAVEDFAGIAPHLAEELHVPVALFDRPWNRDATELGNGNGAPIVRCRTWDEVRERFPTP